MDEALEKQAESFMRSHPGLRDIDLLIADMNGVFRGKRVGKSVSREKLLKICREGMYLPVSVFAMDVNGETMEETGFGISSGGIACAKESRIRSNLLPAARDRANYDGHGRTGWNAILRQSQGSAPETGPQY